MTLREKFEADYAAQRGVPASVYESQRDTGSENSYWNNLVQYRWEGYQLAMRSLPVESLRQVWSVADEYYWNEATFDEVARARFKTGIDSLLELIEHAREAKQQWAPTPAAKGE